ncbi:hypothetical protein SISNIDRAFT_483141 [Sistotremastrum niveocremeum HHB9708]|uniref:Uncharacterized protein n=1 Tax=Sistotremastrum niveocremeum HHB9708 TaxID=1314777 RepID=A0A164Y528_9AGAM|nr:hypothetical protein SISNIDRAFT_483141 [Sistotremastrum niveocremeum HHB9708]
MPRDSLVALLSSSLFANVTWRSQSRVFQLSSWTNLPAEHTWRQRIEEHVRSFGASDATAALFVKFSEAPTQLEELYSKKPALRDQLANGKYAHAYTHTWPRQFFMCVLCDLLMWAMEPDLIPFPDLTPHPLSKPLGVDEFPSMDSLESQVFDLTKVFGSSNPRNQISLSENSDAAVVKELLDEMLRRQASGRLGQVRTNLYLFTATTLAHLFEWSKGYLASTLQCFQHIYGHCETMPESSLAVRELLPYYRAIVHSPLHLLTDYARLGSASHVTLGRLAEHTGVRETLTINVLSLEKAVLVCLKSMLATAPSFMTSGSDSAHSSPPDRYAYPEAFETLIQAIQFAADHPSSDTYEPTVIGSSTPTPTFTTASQPANSTIVPLISTFDDLSQSNTGDPPAAQSLDHTSSNAPTNSNVTPSQDDDLPMSSDQDDQQIQPSLAAEDNGKSAAEHEEEEQEGEKPEEASSAAGEEESSSKEGEEESLLKEGGKEEDSLSVGEKQESSSVGEKDDSSSVGEEEDDSSSVGGRTDTAQDEDEEERKETNTSKEVGRALGVESEDEVCATQNSADKQSTPEAEAAEEEEEEEEKEEPEPEESVVDPEPEERQTDGPAEIGEGSEVPILGKRSASEAASASPAKRARTNTDGFLTQFLSYSEDTGRALFPIGPSIEHKQIALFPTKKSNGKKSKQTAKTNKTITISQVSGYNFVFERVHQMTSSARVSRTASSAKLPCISLESWTDASINFTSLDSHCLCVDFDDETQRHFVRHFHLDNELLAPRTLWLSGFWSKVKVLTTCRQFNWIPMDRRYGLFLMELRGSLHNLPSPVSKVSLPDWPPELRASFFNDPRIFRQRMLLSTSALTPTLEPPLGTCTWLRITSGHVFVFCSDDDFHSPDSQPKWQFQEFRTCSELIFPPGKRLCIFSQTDSQLEIGYFYSRYNIQSAMRAALQQHVCQGTINASLSVACEALLHNALLTYYRQIHFTPFDPNDAENSSLYLFDRLQAAYLLAWLFVMPEIINTGEKAHKQLASEHSLHLSATDWEKALAECDAILADCKCRICRKRGTETLTAMALTFLNPESGFEHQGAQEDNGSEQASAAGSGPGSGSDSEDEYTGSEE